MTESTTPLVNENATQFPSLTALRAAHVNLLRRYRENNRAEDSLADIIAFLYAGQATGALLNDTEERWTAQSLLDYWATTLYQAGREPPNSTLAEFNPLLAPELSDDACPYLGLDAFLERDHPRFFGRQRPVAELVERLKTQRLLAIVGPSGSGKSSLALAGLLAALKRDSISGSRGWRYFPRIVPGSDPLANLARVLYPSLHRDPSATPDIWIKQQTALLRADPDHLAH